MNSRKPTRFLSRPRLLGLIGVVIFTALLVVGGPRAWELVRSSSPAYVGLALVVTLAWTVVGSLRWQTWNNALAGRSVCSSRRYYATFTASAALGQLLSPILGNLGGRPLLLSWVSGEPISRTFFATLLDGICDIAFFVLMAGPAALGLLGILPLAASLMLMGLIAVLGYLGLRLAHRRGFTVLGTVARSADVARHVPLAGRRLSAVLHQLHQSALPSHGTTERIYVYTAMTFMLSMARQVVMMKAMRLDIPWMPLAITLPVAHMILLVGITPSALGIFEVSWLRVLTWAGVSSNAVLPFVLGRRLYMTAFVPVWLFVSLWIDVVPFQIYRRQLARHALPAESESASTTPDTPVA